MLNEVIYLITKTDKQYDDDGFEISNTPIRVQCFASIKSITYKEYYEAKKIDEQVTDIFVVSETDYNCSMYVDSDGKKHRPDLVEYDGTLYKIIRRFRKATSANYTIELTCREVE